MSVLQYVRTILLPPNKGDIKLRCKMPERYSIDEETEPILEKVDVTVANNNAPIDHLEECGCEKEDDDEENGKFEKLLFRFRNALNILFNKNKEEIMKVEELEEDEYYVTSPLDTFIGYAVDVAGSIYVMLLIFLLLIGWILWGCLTGATDTWQIVMQDGQSIQTYVWNTFLMRQQLDNDEKLLLLYGKLKSRSLTHKRLIEKFTDSNMNIMEDFNDPSECVILENELNENPKLIDYKSTKLFDKCCDFFGKVVGSLPAVFIYWVGIFVWIGCGRIPFNEGTKDHPDMQTFSNTWQMYVNTATAIELLITTVFLENVRNRNGDFVMHQTKTFNEMDSDLEYMLRDLDNDYYENELVVVQRCPRDKTQKCISLYAHVVGNGLGLIISICVFSAWIGIGNVMHWSANWWLVIGSYTGLVGFIDGFVLREIFFSITDYEQKKFLDLLKDSQELLDILNIPVELERPKLRKTLSNRVSIFINNICSSKYSVIFSFLTVIGLVIFASSLRWSETAQLVANTPTMIIEGFFLLILVQAHNWAVSERSLLLSELTKSRILIHDHIKKFTSRNQEIGTSSAI
jgi:low-affinity ferrous iron transport protein